MIEEIIVELYEKTGHTWKLDSGFRVQPEEQDVTKVLDEAARVLYDEPVGNRCEVGGLIVEKTEHDYIVYAVVGRYT